MASKCYLGVRYLSYTQLKTAVLDKFGAKHVTVLQPQLVLDNRKQSQKEEKAKKMIINLFRIHNIDIKKRAEYFYRNSEKKLKEKKERLLNAVDVFKDDRLYYFDYCHYTDIGAATIAQFIAGNLLGHDYIKPNRPSQTNGESFLNGLRE